jgi:hypothetical protein
MVTDHLFAGDKEAGEQFLNAIGGAEKEPLKDTSL